MTAAFRDRGAFYRGRPLGAPFREPVALRCPGWPAGAPAACFHRCARHRLDLFPAAFAAETRPHALSRFLQVDVSTSTTVDRSSIPIRGIRGRDDCHAPAGSCLLIGAAAEALRGQGSSNRCSTFPVAIARARDLAPTPIAPGTWCRETPSPAGLERRGGRSDAASVERACKARPPEGRCGGGHPRRCPALTNPRCLLSQGRSRTNGRMPVSRS
jgi:hypothetical protein